MYYCRHRQAEPAYALLASSLLSLDMITDHEPLITDRKGHFPQLAAARTLGQVDPADPATRAPPAGRGRCARCASDLRSERSARSSYCLVFRDVWFQVGCRKRARRPGGYSRSRRRKSDCRLSSICIFPCSFVRSFNSSGSEAACRNPRAVASRFSASEHHPRLGARRVVTTDGRRRGQCGQRRNQSALVNL